MNTKLRVALDYLGDRLATHHASKFKPAKYSLLDQWLAARRLGHEANVSRPGATVGRLPARVSGPQLRMHRTG